MAGYVLKWLEIDRTTLYNPKSYSCYNGGILCQSFCFLAQTLTQSLTNLLVEQPQLHLVCYICVNKKSTPQQSTKLFFRIERLLIATFRLVLSPKDQFRADNLTGFGMNRIFSSNFHDQH